VRLAFGDCVLDTELRQLTRAGREVRLSPKAFRLLEVLAERRPRAVAKGELRTLVWPEMAMGGTTPARLLHEVRTALGDDPRGARFIRTVQRFGYAFCAAAVEESGTLPSATPHCAVQWGARLIALQAGENLIGRAPDAVISIALRDVSRRHARILVGEHGATLEDLGSKHGTLVGASRVQGSVELKHGDEITVGPVLLVFRSGGDESTF
jgi:DNA-binding winged helix-turn-helix (wHTH) protein